MKTKIYTMLAVAAVMASCSKEDVVSVGANDSGRNQIGFSTYSSLNLTKGTPVADNDAFKDHGQAFDVSAFIDITAFTAPYLKTTVTYDDGTTTGTSGTAGWKYANTEFWPSDAAQKLDFYAYANVGKDNTNPTPADNTVAVTKDGITATDYVVSTDITNQKDFMYAAVQNVENVTDTGNNVTDGAVMLNFRHALTQINFTAQVMTADVTVEIEKIELCKINSTGTFTVGTAISTGESSNNIGTWDPATPATSTLSTYAVTPSSVVSVTNANSSSVAIAINNGDASATDELMLMPQTFAKWVGSSKASSQDNAYILVTCKMYKAFDKDGAGADTEKENVYYIGDSGNYGTTAIPVASISGNGTDGNSPEWLGGLNITYNLKFGADPTDPTNPGGGKDPETGKDTLVPISFDTDVVDWVVYDSDSTNNTPTDTDDPANVPM